VPVASAGGGTIQFHIQGVKMIIVSRGAVLAAVMSLVVSGAPAVGAEKQAAKGPEWSMNATIIEACSCPMFCQCYFGDKPAEHSHHGGDGSGHFCKFNNAFKVNRGTYGAVKLDGAKFWVSGDLGADFSKGQMDWAVLTYDKSMNKEQRDAVGAILGHLYPVTWGSFTTGEGLISWIAGKDQAHALLDGGKTAEVALKRFPGMTSEPVVIKNLKYWGAPRNEGFVLMPNEVEAYRAGDRAFEFKGTNGFMITLDMTSKDVAAAAAAAK